MAWAEGQMHIAVLHDAQIEPLQAERELNTSKGSRIEEVSPVILRPSRLQGTLDDVHRVGMPRLWRCVLVAEMHVGSVQDDQRPSFALQEHVQLSRQEVITSQPVV